MIKHFTTTERIVFAIGLLLATSVPFVINGHYLPIPDFWGGFLGGLGIGFMIAIFIRVVRRRKNQ